jgi:predicted alpha/beta superfamily hydrolase
MFLSFSLLSVWLFASNVGSTQIDTIHSTYVQDDFVITIQKPASFSNQKSYHHVYMTDGSLGIGDYVLGRTAGWKATVPANCIIIAISHIGDWHDKRPRDLIPSDISNNAGKNFGKAHLFYQFLQKELIPNVEKNLPRKMDRVFIGHSFGGLFCLYTLFREDKLFDRHFAISPSIWANYYELDKIESLYSKKNTRLHAKVVMYVGALEFLNKVLYSTRSFYKTIRERKYGHLQVEKIEIGGVNHFSIRKPAIDKIFQSLK